MYKAAHIPPSHLHPDRAEYLKDICSYIYLEKQGELYEAEEVSLQEKCLPVDRPY